MASGAEVPVPGLELAWEAEVAIGPRQDLGRGPDGHRFIVPILGGWFDGPLGRGRVLPGGADRQRTRADGVRELHALYEMQADDGAVITVHNHVLVDESVPGPRYARSVIHVETPEGPWSALRRRVLVGTLHSLRPARDAVHVRAYVLR
jgi:hypothetical protein